MTPSPEAAGPPGPLILAAGGIVERQAGSTVEIVLVHRHIHGPEWGLPKGKQEPGERLEDTALREVTEETGCIARIGDWGGVVHYFHGSSPKLVVFWRMICEGDGGFRPSPEVVEARWLPPAAALALMSHAEERSLVASVYRLA
ncbi:MAG: NUDIX domain-containing protein [Thermodesulfobacteriota bacterium]